MKVARLTIENFRGVREATLHFDGHTLMVGTNNVGKSTICEALDLVLGLDRLNRTPVVEEYDFYNAGYLNAGGTSRPIRIEVILIDLTAEVRRICAANLEHWHVAEKRLIGTGEIAAVDGVTSTPCLRLVAIAKYDPDEDGFDASSFYAFSPHEHEGDLTKVPRSAKRAFGFLYLRALRTGSRALSLERGSLLDVILRMKEARTGLWEHTRKRLLELDPPIHHAAADLAPILEAIESRLSEYIPIESDEGATKFFVSQLTREHLRKTIAFFLAMSNDQHPVPFQQVGTGTLNTLVLALLTFIAEIKKENVIFAMEEPEIALPPHTQRRIVKYLLEETSQCFVTSHSPYLIERFEPDHILILTRTSGSLSARPVTLASGLKAKTYRQHLRRLFAEAMLSRGVIVAEGITEQMTLAAASQMMEASGAYYPLDLAGVVVLTADGDGNLSEYGSFFRSLGIATFAYFDRKKRKQDEIDKITSSFDEVFEISNTGCETLLAKEVPLNRQWEFLERLRSESIHPHVGVPATRPSTDDVLRELTVTMLKAGKGEGLAADLLECCTLNELPVSVTSFLKKVYNRFPPPNKPNAAASQPSKAPSAPEAHDDV